VRRSRARRPDRSRPRRSARKAVPRRRLFGWVAGIAGCGPPRPVSALRDARCGAAGAPHGARGSHGPARRPHQGARAAPEGAGACGAGVTRERRGDRAGTRSQARKRCATRGRARCQRSRAWRRPRSGRRRAGRRGATSARPSGGGKRGRTCVREGRRAGGRKRGGARDLAAPLERLRARRAGAQVAALAVRPQTVVPARHTGRGERGSALASAPRRSCRAMTRRRSSCARARGRLR
jgi:hypothetical protein